MKNQMKRIHEVVDNVIAASGGSLKTITLTIHEYSNIGEVP